MKDKLAVFDLDGTLYDTRKVNFYSYQKALEKYNVVLDYDFFSKNCNGRHYTEFLPDIMGSEEHINEVHRDKKMLYSHYLYEAIENTHLFDIIEGLQEQYYIALVTTASRKNCEDILRAYNRHSMFDLILSQEDVVHKKPNPEGFIKAMEYFRIEKCNTIIFEDSDVGVEAAEKSGANVFVVKGFS